MVTIMTTVVGTIYDFTTIYPKSAVYFKGVDEVRKELYDIILKRKHHELLNDFTIFGIKEVTDEVHEVYETYNPAENYSSFIIVRKNSEPY